MKPPRRELPATWNAPEGQAVTPPTLYGKPVLEQLITDVVQAALSEPDPKRRHKYEMLVVQYRYLAVDGDSDDATPEAADAERRDLGIPERGE